MLIKFYDGLLRESDEKEYEEIKKEAANLISAAVKNGYTREEAEEMYEIRIIKE